MNSSKNTQKGSSSLLRPFTFSFIVKEPLATCVEILQNKHELHMFRASYHIKIEAGTEMVYKFFIGQPRRHIPIKAVGNLTAISDTSTEITGKISGDIMPFSLLIVFALLVLAFAVTQGNSGIICFGPLGLLILSIGATIELIRQYYAKLDLFTFIKRSFEGNV